MGIPEDLTVNILESISDGVFTVDQDWKITSFNRSAERITGVSRKEAIGQNCYEVFKSNMCEASCPLRRTMKTGKPLVDRTGYCVTKRGKRVPISVSTAVLRDLDGTMIGGAETFRDLSEIEELKKELVSRGSSPVFRSKSPAMEALLAMVNAAADSTSSILIQGETGTGKEVLARTVHALSPRKDGPFVAINCAAIPESLLESELFGYRKGAFTGADRDKPGRFALAEGGTLFLDEIGELSPALQVKLLRVLQEREYEPLGSVKPVKTDVRLLSATNRDLLSLIESGGFRRDLYYRVNVIALSLPPLRDRKEDIPDLVAGFLATYCSRTGRKVDGISPEVFARFYAYDWPGNIRELENVVERMVVLATGPIAGPELLPAMVKSAHERDPSRLRDESHGAQDNQERALYPKPEDDTIEPSLPEQSVSHIQPASVVQARIDAERGYIIAALEAHAWKRAETASVLGMDKTTLWRKMKRFGIIPPA